jgi:hypothetical protein
VNKNVRTRLSALAKAYVDTSDGNPAISLGYATLYLSSAGARPYDDPKDASEHLREWATGAAAFAVAAASSASQRSIDQVVRDAETLASDPGFDGGEQELGDWLITTFGILGRASVESAKHNAERATEEATLAAAVIVRLIDKFGP